MTVALHTTEGALDLAAVAWTDADITKFVGRRSRLLRWGWGVPDAEALADRLARRDRSGDLRVSCTECRHFRPSLCANHADAGLGTKEVGRDLAGLLQRCPGFGAKPDGTSEAPGSPAAPQNGAGPYPREIST